MVIQILATSNQIIDVTHKSNQPTHFKLQSPTKPFNIYYKLNYKSKYVIFLMKCMLCNKQCTDKNSL